MLALNYRNPKALSKVLEVLKAQKIDLGVSDFLENFTLNFTSNREYIVSIQSDKGTVFILKTPVKTNVK